MMNVVADDYTTCGRTTRLQSSATSRDPHRLGTTHRHQVFRDSIDLYCLAHFTVHFELEAANLDRDLKSQQS